MLEYILAVISSTSEILISNAFPDKPVHEASFLVKSVVFLSYIFQ